MVAEKLTLRALSRATLARQGLLRPIRTRGPAAAVERIGSLQAQHPEWPPVALAARAATRSAADLAGALGRGEVVRSSLMRRTIHVVTAQDLWPMFAVCEPMRIDGWRQLARADPATSPLGRRLHAGHRVVVDALRQRPMSSLEIDELLAAEAGLEPDPVTRSAGQGGETQVVARTAWRHFSAYVPLVHVPVDGERYGRSRYALAEDWLGTGRPDLDPADARAHLARRYLSAFGPADIDDLAAYVGRGRGGIGIWRQAIAALGDEVIHLETDDGRGLLDLADAPRPDPETPAPPRLLARWDSALLSHAARRRQRIMADRDRDKVFSKNADVLPTLLLDGFVAGTWELRRPDGGPDIIIRPFERLAPTMEDAIGAEAQAILSRLTPGATGGIVTFERWGARPST
jgi:hypothetical protein